MKNCLFVALVFILASCGQNSTDDELKNKNLLSTDMVANPRSANGTDTAAMNALPTMDFTDTLYNFGNMHEGETVMHDFEFKNNGGAPLIISNAKGSCGCTVPDYPTEPVAPGKTATINVKFNSEGKQGHQEKTVTLFTNSKRGPQMLYIKADVQPK